MQDRGLGNSSDSGPTDYEHEPTLRSGADGSALKRQAAGSRAWTSSSCGPVRTLPLPVALPLLSKLGRFQSVASESRLELFFGLGLAVLLASPEEVVAHHCPGDGDVLPRR